LCGDEEVDVDDWMNHTTYEGDFSSSHKTVQFFWNSMRELDNEELRKVLRKR